MNKNLALFLVRSLDRGGAERQLVTLTKELAKRGHQVAVAVFYSGGVFEAELAAAGVRLIRLDKKGRWDVLPFLIRLVRLVRQERPAVLHGYLTVSNLFTAVLKPLISGTRVVWGVRASNMDFSRYDWLSHLTDLLERKLSRLADCIIANSHAGKHCAVMKGFSEDKIVVIPNGIDTTRFQFDPEGRWRVRAEWGAGEDEILVGLAARLDPMKDHPTFLEAASRIVSERHNVRFVCVGEGSGAYAETLKQQAVALGLSGKLIWAGARDDMPSVYSALDIASSSSSFGEGFSNTIAEAMACSVPCVATDVGDSAWIVGGAGIIVTPADPHALAGGLMRLIDLPASQRIAIGEAASMRIAEEFGVEALASHTERILGLTQCE